MEPNQAFTDMDVDLYAYVGDDDRIDVSVRPRAQNWLADAMRTRRSKAVPKPGDEQLRVQQCRVHPLHQDRLFPPCGERAPLGGRTRSRDDGQRVLIALSFNRRTGPVTVPTGTTPSPFTRLTLVSCRRSGSPSFTESAQRRRTSCPPRQCLCCSASAWRSYPAA
jgi:hypothetical protein